MAHNLTHKPPVNQQDTITKKLPVINQTGTTIKHSTNKKQAIKKQIKDTKTTDKQQIIDPYSNRNTLINQDSVYLFNNIIAEKSAPEYFENELHEGYQNIIDPFSVRQIHIVQDRIAVKGSIISTSLIAEKENITTSQQSSDILKNGREYTASLFSSSYEWIIAVLLLSLVILAWVRQFYNKYLIGNITAGFNYKVAHKLYLDNNNLAQRVSLALFATFMLNSGVYIFQMLKIYEVNFSKVNGVLSLLIFSFVILILYLTKRFAVTVIGTVSRQAEIAKEYLHHVSVYNKILGLALFPVIFSIPFIPYETSVIVVKMTWFLWLIFYMMKIIRGIRIIIYKHFSVFYLILYFCTLEILPVLIVYKVFISLI